MDLKFWKKDDDFSTDSFPDLPSDENSAFSQSSSSTDLSDGYSAPSQEPQFSAPMQQQQPQHAQPAQSNDDVHTQLILARLDAITNKLDVLSSRIERIEGQLQSAQDQKQKKPRGPWYGE